MPAGVRAARSTISTGFSAATSRRAASETEPESPCGAPARIETGYVNLALVWNRIFLQLAVHHQEYRHHRRGHRDLVGANGGLGKMWQRGGKIVPLHIVTDHRGGILHGRGER